MFAYCLNNPVICYDPSGNACIMTCNGPVDLFTRGVCGYTCQGGGNGGGGSISSKKKPFEKIEQVIDYVTNTDEQTVLDAVGIAFYNGCIVLKAPIGTDAFSFGIIVVGDDVASLDTVRHEYGHVVHMSQVGMPTYFLTAAIPSLIGYWTGVPYDDYYSLPWEYVADYFGGVNRDNGSYVYADWADSCAGYYWIATLIIGEFFQ